MINNCLQSIETFGQSIEGAIIKYGPRNIVEQQFVLNRLAQAAFDIFTMTTVLSRATASANKKLPSVEHEFLMAETWCSEVSLQLYICILNNHIVLHLYS